MQVPLRQSIRSQIPKSGVGVGVGDEGRVGRTDEVKTGVGEKGVRVSVVIVRGG